MFPQIINRGEQSVTLTFKVNGQGHSKMRLNHDILQTVGRRELTVTCAPT